MARNGDSHEGLIETDLQILDGLHESDDSEKPITMRNAGNFLNVIESFFYNAKQSVMDSVVFLKGLHR